MLDFSYHRRTRLHFGKEALAKLAEELPCFGAKVLLVTGDGSVHKSGLYERVQAELGKAGKTVFEVTGVKPEKFEQYARRVWGVTTPFAQAAALEGIEKTKTLLKDLGAPTALREVGIGPDRLPEMAKKATRNGPIGAYKKLGAADVEAILRDSL